MRLFWGKDQYQGYNIYSMKKYVDKKRIIFNIIVSVITIITLALVIYYIVDTSLRVKKSKQYAAQIIEYQKQQALEKLAKYKAYYFEQPTEINGVLFDADEQARNRLTQNLVVNGASGYLPPVWIAADNSQYPIATLADLMDIVNGVQAAFATRFFEMDTLRQQILAAGDEAALSAVVIPSVPNQF